MTEDYEDIISLSKSKPVEDFDADVDMDIMGIFEEAEDENNSIGLPLGRYGIAQYLYGSTAGAFDHKVKRDGHLIIPYDPESNWRINNNNKAHTMIMYFRYSFYCDLFKRNEIIYSPKRILNEVLDGVPLRVSNLHSSQPWLHIEDGFMSLEEAESCEANFYRYMHLHHYLSPNKKDINGKNYSGSPGPFGIDSYFYRNINDDQYRNSDMCKNIQEVISSDKKLISLIEGIALNNNNFHKVSPNDSDTKKIEDMISSWYFHWWKSLSSYESLCKDYNIVDINESFITFRSVGFHKEEKESWGISEFRNNLKKHTLEYAKNNSNIYYRDLYIK